MASVSPDHPRVKISLSKSESMKASDQLRFDCAEGEFKKLGKQITSKVWSPIVWKGGIRRKKNFLQSEVIALDFDSGEWTTADAILFLKEYGLAGLIGTTKSHQIAKGDKPAVDRFRLLIQAEVCSDIAQFSATMALYMDNIPCDKSCKDGARFYFPCREIVAEVDGGLARWRTDYEVKTIDRSIAKPGDYNFKNIDAAPRYLQSQIIDGVGKDDSRHRACYRIGAEFGKLGFNESEIFEILLKFKSPLLMIGESDVQRAIANGLKEGTGQNGI